MSQCTRFYILYQFFNIIHLFQLGQISLTSSLWVINIYLIEYLKAMNKTSKFQAKLREPGKVWAGADAGIEWTWEPQTERFIQVGFAAGEALKYPKV